MKPLALLATVLALIATTVAACGDDDGDGGETVSAEAYASDVCAAVGTWIDSILAGAEEAAAATGGTPEDGKQLLVDFIGQSLDDTTTARDALEEAGTPDVEGGDETASALVAAFDQAVEVFEQASADAEDLPTDSPQAFQQAATELGNTAQGSLEEAGNVLSELDESEELRTATEDSQECQDLEQLSP